MKIRRPTPQRAAEAVSAPYSNALLGGGIQDDSRIYTDLLKAIQPGTPGQTPRIAVIASSKVTLTKAWQQHHVPDDRPSVAQVFMNMGFEPVFIPLTVDSPQVAHDPKVIAELGTCQAVFLSGGNQVLHAKCLAGTPLLDAIKKLQADGGLVAGSSAGMAVQGTDLYGDGTSFDYLYHGDLAPLPLDAFPRMDRVLEARTNGKFSESELAELEALNFFDSPEAQTAAIETLRENKSKVLNSVREIAFSMADSADPDHGTRSEGLNLLPADLNAVCETHTDRGRFGRTVVAMKVLGKRFGIAANENSALFIHRVGDDLIGEVKGEAGYGGVMLFDNQHAEYPDSEYFSVRKLKLHYLIPGDSINFTTGAVSSDGKPHTPSNDADEPYESDAFFKRYGLKEMDKGGSEAERVLFGFANSSAREVRSNSHEHRRSKVWLPRFDLRIAKTDDTQVHQGAPWGEGHAYSMSNLDVEIVHDTR